MTHTYKVGDKVFVKNNNGYGDLVNTSFYGIIEGIEVSSDGRSKVSVKLFSNHPRVQDLKPSTFSYWVEQLLPYEDLRYVVRGDFVMKMTMVQQGAETVLTDNLAIGTWGIWDTELHFYKMYVTSGASRHHADQIAHMFNTGVM